MTLGHRIEVLRIDYEPRGVHETVGDWLGVLSRRTESDLERFKKFIERRGVESGAFRGTIPSPGERYPEPRAARSGHPGSSQ